MGKYFVIACGGTGGHLFPGLAVAEVLHERGHEILLLVSEKEIDAVALQHHPEFRVEKLPSIGMPSRLSPAFIRFLRRAWESFSHCRQLYRRYRPSAILGMGGFTSATPVLAAHFLNIPSYIHESNAIAGRANRLTARWASKVLLGFQECASFFPKNRYAVTGTPVRRDLGERLSREEALQKFKLSPECHTILVMGGSQGAAQINQILFKSVSLLKEFPIQIIHLTGDRDDHLAAINYQREGIDAYVASFYHHMNEAYSAADFVISRAGAASLSEISHFGLPSLLIPFPFAAEQHQHRNAAIFQQAGAAEVLEESEITPEILVRLITNLLDDSARRARMAHAASIILPRHAAEAVADVMEGKKCDPDISC
ncbi:MAG: undecaprenyldiphospho-muramoylpentapeptide beta-N-acetylglucosaminyltransferase [Chthoniobacterales bacterium]|nr:undecaprenyldiphospho-muramoylpentapeptide beta-N-acetylglucosaminyltransferase [Chthoniobacterales bacterium]